MEQGSCYRHARALAVTIISDRHLRVILARANLRVSETEEAARLLEKGDTMASAHEKCAAALLIYRIQKN